MKKELEKYFVIADTVQEMNGDICEVILHELTKSGSYVAYVANGTVTGQKTGEKSDYFVKQVLENKDFKDDHLSNYFSGQQMKRQSSHPQHCSEIRMVM